ncbi:MAG: DUF4340 domain-containing protein [Alphaproteobacteria bacterium]|nr:DUF4340 domain-containing protein [Alphaproteobacteria bacterium]
MSAVAAQARRRVLLGMGGAALVSVVLAAIALAPPSAPPVRREVGQLVAPDFAAKADAASVIKVSTSEESYSLVRGPAGWSEPEKGGYPVATSRIVQLTHAISGMTFAAPMTRDDKKFDRIGLGDPKRGGTGALVEIDDASGAVLFRRLVGYRDGRSYIREPDDLQAWAVNADDMPPLQRGARWLDLDIVEVDPKAIAEVEVRLAGRPAYRVTPDDASGARFSLAPPYDRRPLAANFAPTLPGQALTHFLPLDVARAGSLREPRLVADHVTRTRSGLVVTVHALKVGDQGWVTLSASAARDAAAGVAAEAEALSRRADGWAFALGANDWSAYATPIEAIIEPR